MAAQCAGCGSSLSDDATSCEICGQAVTNEPAAPPPPPTTELPDLTPRSDSTSVSTERPVRGAQAGGRAATTQLKLPSLRSKKLWVVVAGALVVVIGVVVGARIIFNDDPLPPEESVTAFFKALQDRDATEAKKWVDPKAGLKPLEDPPYQVLLTKAALKSKKYKPPRNVKVHKVGQSSFDSGAMVAEVSYTIGGRRESDQVWLYLEDREKVPDGERPRWRFVEWGEHGITGQIRTELGTPLSEANGITFETKKASRSVDTELGDGQSSRKAVLATFPGVYEVGVPRNPMVEEQATVVRMGANAAVARLTPEYTLKKSGVFEVVDQVNAYLDHCASQDTLTPKETSEELCPFYSRGSVNGPDRNQKNITWTIVKQPRYQVGFNDPAEGGGVFVFPKEHGEAAVSYEAQDETGKWKKVKQVVPTPFDISGPVQVKANSVTWRRANN